MSIEKTALCSHGQDVRLGFFPLRMSFFESIALASTVLLLSETRGRMPEVV